MVTQHLDCFVGEIFGQVIAVFRTVGRLDEVIVLDQVGIPVVGLATEEAIEAVEALLGGPHLAAAAGRDVLLGDVVILAEPEGAVAVVLQDFTDGGDLIR